jgi:cation-transporting P-type ATPase E
MPIWGTDLGLTTADVQHRQQVGLSNSFEAPASRTLGSIVRANALTRFNLIIVACFAVLLIIGRWQDALFGASAILNTLIGAVQEYRAKAALDRLSVVTSSDVSVVRDGTETVVPMSTVVVDDILILRAGDQIAADAVVVAVDALQVDESMLTGESEPVDKAVSDELLSGSIVTAGSAAARVSRVGADSYANKFAVEAKRFSQVHSELRTSVNRVLTWAGWFILPIGALVFNAQMIAEGGWPLALSGGRWADAVVSTVAAVMAMIPLGLVLMTSIAFAVGAVKLSRYQVLVQELAAVEGLARVDTICLDKTGTLTFGDIVFDAIHPFGFDGPAEWRRVLGWYASEPGANATARSLSSEFPAIGTLAPTGTVEFSSARKWSSVSFDAVTPGTWVLGGPEMVFPPGSSPMASEITARTEELAATGRRTLVFAFTPSGIDGSLDAEHVASSGLQPVALITLRERIRPDARETLEYFAQQGVSVRIISGDNPATVAAIAREVGLVVARGIDARTLPEDDAALEDAVEAGLVFGRVTPHQKRSLVQALQRRGHVVAMTGDGVNDALAIKEADVGVAMNSGSPATKAVARLILLDGRFAHLPRVVDEGRQVIANIERVSMLFLTKTAYASGLAVAFGAALATFPFLPRQLSITDGLTIGIPSFFLALLPNRQRYRPGFLRRSLSFAVPAGLVVTAALCLYTVKAAAVGTPEPELRTGATLVLAMVGIWVLVVLSRPLTGFKTVIVGIMMIVLILIFAVPLVRDFLQFVDLRLNTALLVLVATVGAVGGIEIVRGLHRLALRRWDARTTATSVPST